MLRYSFEMMGQQMEHKKCLTNFKKKEFFIGIQDII